MIQPKEIVEKYNEEGCNLRLGLGFKLLKIGERQGEIVYVLGRTNGKTKHTWTYGRSVQLAPYQNFKLSCSKEFPAEMSSEDAVRTLYGVVENNIKRITEELHKEGKLRE